MKHTVFIFSILLIFLTAEAADAENSITGTYRGIIWSNSDHPGTTILKVNSSNKISGTYFFRDTNGENEKGKLTSCNLNGKVLFCHWNDVYGSGDWRVVFSNKFASFKGEWFDDIGGFKEYGIGSGHRWDGKK